MEPEPDSVLTEKVVRADFNGAEISRQVQSPGSAFQMGVHQNGKILTDSRAAQIQIRQTLSDQLVRTIFPPPTGRREAVKWRRAGGS